MHINPRTGRKIQHIHLGAKTKHNILLDNFQFSVHLRGTNAGNTFYIQSETIM